MGSTDDEQEVINETEIEEGEDREEDEDGQDQHTFQDASKPIGLKWFSTAQRMNDEEDVSSAMVDRYKAEVEELTGIFNFIHTRAPHRIKKVTKANYDILEKGMEAYLDKVISGIAKIIRLQVIPG